MKLGPVFAMGGVLGLAVWLMLGPLSPRSVPLQPGEGQFEISVAQQKLRVVQTPTPGANSPPTYSYRVVNDPSGANKSMTADEFQAMIASRATAKGRGVILRLFNVSSYANLLWVAVGFGGQALFAGRMWVQWIASERKRQSVVPVAFWYMSLAGGIILTTYFIWRQDLVGVVGQASGLVIYARNIRFLYLKKPAAVPES